MSDDEAVWDEREQAWIFPDGDSIRPPRLSHRRDAMTVDEVTKERAVVEDADEHEPLGRFALLSSLYKRVIDEIASNPNADARALARAAIGVDDETS